MTQAMVWLGIFTASFVVHVVTLSLVAIGKGMVWLWKIFRRRPASGVTMMSSSQAGPAFKVAFENSIPSLEQFRQMLPEQLPKYGFSVGTGYEFEAIRLTTGRYDVMIRRHPSYGRRPAGGHETHRFDAGTQRERICFAEGAEPHTIPEACRVAVLWAIKTDKYIQHGGKWQ